MTEADTLMMEDDSIAMTEIDTVMREVGIVVMRALPLQL
jgi:hypothetical protein